MLVDASLLRRAPLANIARLGRSLGVNVAKLDHAQAVSAVAKAIRIDSFRAGRAKEAERRAQQEEFGRTAAKEWEQLIQGQIG